MGTGCRLINVNVKYFNCFKPKQAFLKLDELPYPALRLLFTMLSDEDLASITSTCSRFKQIADPIWKKRGDWFAMKDYLWRKIWTNCDHEYYSDRFERTKSKKSRIFLKSTPFEQIQTPIKTNSASYRSVMKLTKNYILTRDETSETGLSVHKRHTYEYVGVIGAPFEGEWGWDYETCLPYKELTIEAEPFWIANEAMGMSISSK